jgi:hypothetical protein|tara:strand:- start:523 stop:951 length:429 start_codon:yes stop_codon:yes gene_type:complete
MNQQPSITINGKEFTVRRLTVGQIHTVGDRIFKRIRDTLSEDCLAAGLDSADTLREVRKLRDEWANGIEVLRQAYTYRGALAFVGFALSEAGEDLAVLDDTPDLKELVTASATVLGLPDPFDDSNQEPVDPDEEEIVPDDQG